MCQKVVRSLLDRRMGSAQFFSSMFQSALSGIELEPPAEPGLVSISKNISRRKSTSKASHGFAKRVEKPKELLDQVTVPRANPLRAS